ncbi:MAG: alkaline phosphatase family protein [Steroidobacteraceae bacterium]
MRLIPSTDSACAGRSNAPAAARGQARRWALPAMLAVTLIAGGTAHAAIQNPLAFAPDFRCSTDRQASSTVPGWVITAGSPALLCAGALRASWPAQRSPRVIVASGPWGASTLERTLRFPRPAPASMRFAASAWLGISGPSTAPPRLTGVFLGPSGAPMGSPFTLRGPHSGAPQATPVRFAQRARRGAVPRGAVALRLTLRLSGRTGGAASYVGAMRLTVRPQVDFPPPEPPRARVPRFDHVFLIMMENTDFRQVVGDRKDAPYLNALAARGTLLANYQAVYHPSDENYLAIAGGDTFVAGGQYFPNIHIASRNLGDLLESAGKSWKVYEQGMGVPCNTTTHYDKYYEPDDAPFFNFTDIRANAARCRAHLLPLRNWVADLRRAVSTPAFAWLAADDYDDGEASGNGSPQSLRVQDAWLRKTLAPLFRSAAWRDQKSLLIITWDESNTLKNDHVATIVLGSRHTVRAGYVSTRRYDHYSTARVIEAALGLPSLTSNDAYARPFNDAFVRR